MPEQLLHCPKIRPPGEQVGRERMAQRVDLATDTACDAQFRKTLPDTLPRYALPRPVEEHALAFAALLERWPALRQVAFEPVQGVFPERQDPFLASFTYHPDEPLLQVHRVEA